jgi:hypothetical protein
VISIEARGRLGNHLFQFAFGLAAAARLGTDFAMNDELLRPSFRLGDWNSPARRAARSVRFRAAQRLAPHRVVKVESDDDPAVVLDELADDVHYAGFFQSQRYFLEVERLVRDAFEPQGRHVEKFNELYGGLVETGYVCCHVRRTDYEITGSHLPLAYYRECLRLADVSSDVPIVFVGDDLTEVGQEFGAEPGVQLEHNDEIVDLQLLTNASVVVTSNSSFGWWGAWLGGESRRVFAPRHWLGFRHGVEVPRAVVPDRWSQVPVAPG